MNERKGKERREKGGGDGKKGREKRLFQSGVT